MSGHESVRDGMNRLETVVEALVERLQAEPSVAGAFLGGSLAAGRADDFSDVDLAVVAAEGREEEAWGLRGDLAAIPGLPRRTLERSWPGARMVACLYGPQAYPPLGLEVDIAFCALAEVDAPMPYAPSRIVLDRSGGLARALAGVASAPTQAGLDEEVERRRSWFAFYAHDALVAERRGDLPQLAFLLGQMMEAIVAVAAARHGELGHWAKGGPRWLAPQELDVIQAAMQAPGRDAVRQLGQLFERYTSSTG
jgi:predicted nucleotidyltransferase